MKPGQRRVNTYPPSRYPGNSTCSPQRHMYCTLHLYSLLRVHFPSPQTRRNELPVPPTLLAPHKATSAPASAPNFKLSSPTSTPSAASPPPRNSITFTPPHPLHSPLPRRHGRSPHARTMVPRRPDRHPRLDHRRRHHRRARPMRHCVPIPAILLLHDSVPEATVLADVDDVYIFRTVESGLYVPPVFHEQV